MLDELVEKIKTNRENRINEFHQINCEIEQLKVLMANLEEKILSSDKSRCMLSIYKKRNFIQNFIYKHFSKDYKVASIKDKEILEEIQNMRQEVNEIKTKILDLETSSHTINIEEDQKVIDTLNNRDSAISYLIRTYPELCEKEEFMEEIVKHNFENIIYDRTNSDAIYLELIEQVKGNFLENINNSQYSMESVNIVFQNFQRKMQEEMNISSAKYQIPKKYYFETIRKGIEEYKENENIHISTSIEDYIVGDLLGLEMKDGKFPKEFGEKIECLYEDKNNYLLEHTIFHSRTDMTQEEIENIKSNIFKNGLKIPCHDALGKNETTLDNTTVGNYSKISRFSHYLVDAPTILMQIPKETIENNDEFIFGADKPDIINSYNPAYLLPEYVIGYIDDSEGIENIKFQHNTIEDKKQYSYRLRLGESQGRSVEYQEKHEDER